MESRSPPYQQAAWKGEPPAAKRVEGRSIDHWGNVARTLRPSPKDKPVST